MKRRSILMMVALGLLLGTAALLPPGCSNETEEHEHAATEYYCPMHPTVVSDKPGDCPICNMTLVPREETEGTPADTSAAANPSAMPGLATIGISPETRQAMGLKLGMVEKRPLSRQVRTSARVVADETRIHHVTVKVDGWVHELFAAVIGQHVEAGDPLFTIYSPDLLSAQQEYLTAVEQRDNLGEGADADARQNAAELVQASRRRLELWDVSASQIDRLEETRRVEKYLTFYAHTGGVIIARDILAGHGVTAGEVLMTIADLSHVWGDADVYQSDLLYVHVGMPLEISFPYWRDRTFRGRVIFVSPTLDPETRTLKARLEIPNPELLLRPGMYGDAALDYVLGERLSIPAEAVMFSGETTYAFKDGGAGRLIPTEVRVGARADGWYELLGGLEEGDRIVVSANFLVDSESSLKAALDAMTGEAMPGDQHRGHVQ
jgi:Cu(I)/Ag(I) efflux system membrane fusion protein